MKFRVWYIINPPSEPIYIPVKTVDEVMIAFSALAKIGNHPSIEEAMTANCSGLEYKDSQGDWVEFMDQNGEDIESYWYTYENSDPSEPYFFNRNLIDLLSEEDKEVEDACT